MPIQADDLATAAGAFTGAPEAVVGEPAPQAAEQLIMTAARQAGDHVGREVPSCVLLYPHTPQALKNSAAFGRFMKRIITAHR